MPCLQAREVIRRSARMFEGACGQRRTQQEESCLLSVPCFVCLLHMDMGVQLPCMEMGLLLYMEMAVLTLGMGLAVQVFRLLWFECCGVKAAMPLPQPDLLTSRCFCQRLPVAASSVACFLEAPRTEYHLHGT